MIYYHGTKSAIHLSDKPYLDVEHSARPDGVIKKDKHDPEIPHVYVTDMRLKAMLFSLPAPQKAMASGCYDSGQGFVIYTEKPEFAGPCHLYTIKEENIPGGVEQRVKGQYVSYCNIPLSAEQHSLVPIEDVLSSARIFYLDAKTTPQAFSSAMNGIPEQGLHVMVPFMEKMKAAGALHEYGNAPRNGLKPPVSTARLSAL